MKTETTMWACGDDWEGQPFVVLVPVKESAKMFVLDEDRLPANDRPIRKALDFKRHVSKQERVLFPTREAAIQARIQALQLEHDRFISQAVKISDKIEALKALQELV